MNSHTSSVFDRLEMTVNRHSLTGDRIKGGESMSPNDYRLTMVLLTLILVIVAIAQLAR